MITHLSYKREGLVSNNEVSCRQHLVAVDAVIFQLYLYIHTWIKQHWVTALDE